LFGDGEVGFGLGGWVVGWERGEKQIPFGNDNKKGKGKGNSRFLPHSTSLRVRNDKQKGNPISAALPQGIAMDYSLL
jgi:hypothetical protein